MKKTSNKLLVLSFIIVLVACQNFQFPPKPTEPSQGLLETQAALTISVDQTRRSPTATPTPRPTREPRTATPTTTVIATLTPTIEPTTLPTALFTDDFSTNTGWAQGNFDNYSFGITNNGYFIKVEIPMATIWSAKSIESADIILETEAEVISGPENGYYGLMCRQQNDGFNYYVFVISLDGSFGIGIVSNGTLEFIKESVDRTGSMIDGTGSNRIVGKCIGNNLSLIVNENPLLEVEDDTLGSGLIGLVAGNHNGKELHVSYHYFIAAEP